MKYLLIGSLLFVSNAFSQDCKTYYYLQNNKTIEITINNKKGEPAGKQVYVVSDYKTSGSSASAVVASEMFDKKGKSTTKIISTVKCEGGTMMMDMKMNMPQTGQEYGTTDAKAENFYLEYPAFMNVGDNLKDGHMEIETDKSGMKQTVTLDVTNRKVEAKEKITTPAGSWDCFKITNNSKMRIKLMGIGIPMNMDVTEWFATGFGIVKTESKYGTTEITAIR